MKKLTPNRIAIAIIVLGAIYLGVSTFLDTTVFHVTFRQPIRP